MELQAEIRKSGLDKHCKALQEKTEWLDGLVQEASVRSGTNFCCTNVGNVVHMIVVQYNFLVVFNSFHAEGGILLHCTLSKESWL